MIPHQTLPPPPGTRPAAPPAPPRPAFPPASPFPPMMIDPSMLAAMSDPKLLMAMSSMLIPGGPAPQQTPELEKPPTEAQPETATSLWKEFKTAEGRVFWHNSKTNKSTWDKPDELKTDLERVLATTTMWREYPGGDGKTYWHHLETKQSEWDVPKEVSDIRQVMTELEAEDWTELSKKWETKNHARNAFKEFLSRRGVGHLAKWDDVGKILQRDSKWKLFDCHLTTGERKHAFNEYVNQLQKKTREEQRLKKAAARDALTEFLNKWKNGENNMPPLTGETVYEDFRELAHGEDWWHVLDIRDKAEAFEDLAQQVSRECMQRVPRDLMNQVVQFFEDVLGDELTPESEPDEIVAFLFSSFPADQFKGLHPLQVLDAWSAALRKYFDEEENQKEALQLTLERQNRENFRKLLADAEEEHLLNAKSDWLDFVSGPRPSGGQEGAPLSEEEASVLDRVVKRVTEWVHPGETESSAAGDAESAKGSDSVLRPQTKGVCEDMRYLRLFLQGGSTPRELFEDYVYSLWDIYEELRSVVKDKLTVEGELGQRLIGEPTASLLEFKEILLRDKQLSVPAEMVAKADRPGVLLPLVSSLAKRLKKATQSKQEEELDDAEEGQLKSRPNSARP